MALRATSRWGDNSQEQHSPEEAARILEHAMQSLDPLCRALFVLRDIEQMSIEDAGFALGLSPSVAKHRLLRARLQLGDAAPAPRLKG
jgi:RNA polymerase sigma-70 factor (ECF subfamily)